MYYEARIHEIVEVADATAAAALIRGNIRSYQVVSWISKDEKFQMYAVPDGHIDEQMAELAILRKTAGDAEGKYQQVESITNAWIETVEELALFLEQAEDSDLIMSTDAQLIIGKPEGHEVAYFICSCCGSTFRGNIKYQVAIRPGCRVRPLQEM